MMEFRGYTFFIRWLRETAAADSCRWLHRRSSGRQSFKEQPSKISKVSTGHFKASEGDLNLGERPAAKRGQRPEQGGSGPGPSSQSQVLGMVAARPPPPVGLFLSCPQPAARFRRRGGALRERG